MGIIVDLFAGGGGASQGIFEALGRHPDVAINHSPKAVAIHAANHPATEHWCNDIWSVDPSWIVGKYNQPVDLLWASPDCTHHSKAKGGPPKRDERRRDLAMVISHKWVPALLPRLIILENVEEFLDWGPCDSDGVPIESAKGENFRAFVNALRRRGYKVEWRELSACDYGAPTTRKRLFLMARRDKLPIVWPEPTHGAPDSPEVLSGKLLPWRTAAEIIDWSLPCPSIFATSQEIWEEYGLRAVRPLAENTMKRIAKGLERYVLNNPNPFIIKNYSGVVGQPLESPLGTITTIDHHALVQPFVVTNTTGHAPWGTGQPLSTVTTGGQQMLVNPFVMGVGGLSYAKKPVNLDRPLGAILSDNSRVLIVPFISKQRGTNIGYGTDEPVQTVSAGGTHHALVTSFLTSYYGPSKGNGSKNECRANAATSPVFTQTTENRFSLVVPHLQIMYSKSTCQDCVAPVGTITSRGKHALVSAFFVKYYGTGDGAVVDAPLHTATTKDRFSLVTIAIDGEPYIITDIGMRMLSPKELLLAQGFPASYVIDEIDGKKVSKKDQVAMIGNSVCPPIAKALVKANYRETKAEEIRTKKQTLPLFRYLQNRAGKEVRV